MRNTLPFLFVLVAMAMPTMASADLVRWTVNNGTFTDGTSCPVGDCGTVAGYLIWDSAADEFSDWALDVAAGDTTLFPEITYTPSNSIILFSSEEAGSNQMDVRFDDRFLTFVSEVVGNLKTLLGTPVPVFDFTTREGYVASPLFRSTPDAFLSGAVVPLPAAAWLFASALGLLAWGKRRGGR